MTTTLRQLRRAGPERRQARSSDLELIEHAHDALALLRSKWAVDVIVLMAGGIHRHAHLVDNVPGLSKKVLTGTLRRLERDGVVHRRVFAEAPGRVEYALTPLGWRLTELVMALYEWARDGESRRAA